MRVRAFGNNIMFSAVVHMTIITAALALAGRGAALRVPDEYVKVTLIGPAETLQQGMGVGRKEEPAKGPEQQVKRKRLQKTTAPPPAVTERKESTPDPLPETKISSQDGTGPAKGDQAEVAGSLQGDQGEGFRRTSSGVLQVAVLGRENRKDDPAAGEERKTGSGPWAVGAIRNAIERAKTYPALARKRNQEGTVVMEFSINAKGVPENIRVTKSSGFSLLDTAAKETVIRAAPLPAVQGSIEVPITFILKKEH